MTEDITVVFEIVDPEYIPNLDPVPFVEDFEKHEQHDQSTHGNWALSSKVIGGAGKDITKELDKIFDDPYSYLQVARMLEAKYEAQISAGSKPGDVVLEYIADLQGFSGKPKTTDTIIELNDLENSGEYITLYRGVSSFSYESYSQGKYIEIQDADISRTSSKIFNEFYDGDYYGGQGVFGNGTYASRDKDNASGYANTMDESEGVYDSGMVMKMLVPKNIKIAPQSVVKQVSKDVSDFWVEKMMSGAEPGETASTHRNETGRRLMSMGYQAFQPSSSQGQPDTFIILDRSVVIVSKEPVADLRDAMGME